MHTAPNFAKHDIYQDVAEVFITNLEEQHLTLCLPHLKCVSTVDDFEGVKLFEK